MCASRNGTAWRLLAIASALLAAGCATLAPPGEPLPAAEQQQRLSELDDFTLTGRAAVSANGEGFNASLVWTQSGAESRVRLSGPVGGSLTLTWRPDFLQVVSSRGETLRDADAEAAIIQQLGFVPPFDALRYWVLGVAAPGEPPSRRVEAANGRVAELEQQQWRMVFERWNVVGSRAGTLLLPQRLTATRDGVRLRVVMDRWKLEAR